MPSRAGETDPVRLLLAGAEKMRLQALEAQKAGKLDMFDYLLKKSQQYRDQAVAIARNTKR